MPPLSFPINSKMHMIHTLPFAARQDTPKVHRFHPVFLLAVLGLALAALLAAGPVAADRVEGLYEAEVTLEEDREAAFSAALAEVLAWLPDTLAGMAEFRQKVRFSEAGTHTITGEMEYQVCDDATCLPPKYEEFSISVTVGEAAATGTATTKSINYRSHILNLLIG